MNPRRMNEDVIQPDPISHEPDVSLTNHKATGVGREELKQDQADSFSIEDLDGAENVRVRGH